MKDQRTELEKLYKPFMTRREASIYTGISYNHIRKGTADGSIPCYKIGDKHLVIMDEWLEQIKNNSRKGTATNG